MKNIVRIISLMMCSLLVLSLAACDVSRYYVTYVEDAFSDIELASDAELIKDYNALLDYISSMSMSEELQNKLESYDMEFFNKHMLVIICHWESSDSTSIEVDDVDYEGTWVEINVDRDKPDIATDYDKNWGIVIEIDRDDNISSATYTVD